MALNTPNGVKDYLPNEATVRVALVARAKEFFMVHGYQRIITPTFELYDILKKGLTPQLEQQAIKFYDDQGVLMLLRPDMTTPIARVVASSMTAQQLPLKLFYAADVFRKHTPQTLRQAEFFQVGVELIGLSGLDADQEIIELLIDLLQVLDIPKFTIDIGHNENAAGLSANAIKALEQQDFVTLGTMPLQGTKAILSKGSYLAALADRLMERHSACVNFNHGFIKDIDYYTGIQFHVHVPGFGYEIGSGGRYDGLLGAYGQPAPAVGFALEVDKLLKLKGN